VEGTSEGWELGVERRSVGDSEGRKGVEEVAGHDWEGNI
jgi:hypothetical protein